MFLKDQFILLHFINVALSLKYLIFIYIVICINNNYETEIHFHFKKYIARQVLISVIRFNDFQCIDLMAPNFKENVCPFSHRMQSLINSMERKSYQNTNKYEEKTGKKG